MLLFIVTEGWAKVGVQLSIWKKTPGYGYYSSFITSASHSHNSTPTFAHPCIYICKGKSKLKMAG